MTPYTIIAGIVLLIAVGLGGVQTGRKLEREEWQRKELIAAKAHAVALEEAHTKYVRAQKFNEEKARKASKDHEKAISDLGKQYATALDAIRADGGLRIPSPCNGTEGPGASGPNESRPGTVKLPDRIESDLFKMTERADKLAEQLRALQNWIKENGHY